MLLEGIELIGRIRFRGAGQLPLWAIVAIVAAAALISFGSWWVRQERIRALVHSADGDGCLACGCTHLTVSEDAMTQRCLSCGYEGALGGGQSLSEDEAACLFAEEEESATWA